MIEYSYLDLCTDRVVVANAHHIAVHYTADQIHVLCFDRDGKAKDMIQVIGYLDPPQQSATYKFTCDKFTIEGVSKS